MTQIHWVGGNLPHIGKSWAVRALTESLFLTDLQVAPIVVDTSPNSPLSEVYNPTILESHTPSKYFIGSPLAADEIFDLAHTHKVLVIKLASHSQATFLEWINSSGILTDDIRHNFWFISNGHRDSINYFQELCNYDWQLNWVRNQHAQVWGELEETDDETDPFNICDLPGIITNPTEIEFIEASGAILHHLAHPENSGIPLLMRVRIQRFLTQSHQNFIDTATQSTKPPPPPKIISKQAEDEDEDKEIPN
jgi:hypothetical protein